MLNKVQNFIFILGSFIISGSVSAQPTLESQRAALDMINATANNICNVVSTRGEANSIEAQGDVSAQLRGLASRLAGVGISGAAQITNERYENVLREHLADTLRDNAICKLKVFETLHGTLLSPVATPRPSPAPVSPSMGRPSSDNTRVHVERNGLRASVESLHSDAVNRIINLAIEIQNTRPSPLALIAAGRDARAIGDNGQEYVGGPSAIVGVSNCHSASRMCVLYIKQGQGQPTELQPGEAVNIQVQLVKSTTSRGLGNISELSSLSIPFFDISANIPISEPQQITLTFGQLKIL